ncbi:hypothetical protein ACFO9Q_10055 [Paenibacillus sp. GCM10023252]|uniref:hypothetical protein n=1 Tax=Paenibacillus sp. GCM10023252 TaxID=3252649 RepID=UPI00360834ED
MYEWLPAVLQAVTTAAQFLFAFAALFFLLRLLPQRRPRFLHLAHIRWHSHHVPERWLGAVRLSREQPSFQERESLLAGCGFTADAAYYVLGRRVLLLFLPAAALVDAALRKWLAFQVVPSAYVLSVLMAVFIFAQYDLPWLRSFRKLRAYRMTKEIYIVSNQLLYLAGSSLHIHTKLMRCVPYTRTIRGDLERLLAEWYQDAEGALRSFKHRIGTDEGLSFTETIDSLRLHESEEYYVLLRERIQDYKEKLELARESRKESTSYFLFVIAGIPILYTFQIFIYPWVREGQKLFDSLS